MNYRAKFSFGAPALFVMAGSMFAVDTQAQDIDEFTALESPGQWEFLNEYCTECHNTIDYSGGVDFTLMSIDGVPDNADVWESAIRKLRSRMMPPAGQPKPEAARNDEFVAWLENYLDEAAGQRDNVHPITIHRLNRKEYANSIRDLFGLHIDPASLLPEDDTSEGFDNIAEALQVSPAFIDQYVSAARQIVEQSVGDKTPSLASTTYRTALPLATRAEGGGVQQGHIEGLPLVSGRW